MKATHPFVVTESQWGDCLQGVMIFAMTLMAAMTVANLLPVDFNLLTDTPITDGLSPVSSPLDSPTIVESIPVFSNAKVWPVQSTRAQTLTSTSIMGAWNDSDPAKLKELKTKHKRKHSRFHKNKKIKQK